MTRTCLTAAQQLRMRQVCKAHDNMKQLEGATAEAVKYHDKYLNAVEKVMTCLLDSSDTWEDVRTHLEPDGAMVNSVSPSTTRLAASYNTWKVSKELRALRDELEGLHQLCKAGHKQSKQAKTNAEDLERVARRCAELNSPKYERKITERSGKAKDKLLGEQLKGNTRLAALDGTVVSSMKSCGTWWSTRLVSCCDDLYACFANIGHKTVEAFPNDAPTQSMPSTVPAGWGTGQQSGYGAPVAPPRMFMNGPQREGNRPPFGAAGLPLQFESRQHAIDAL